MLGENDSPPAVAENCRPGSLAEQAWWARVRRAAKRKGPAGSKLMSDWSHDMISVLGAEGIKYELEPGRGWVEIPPERFTAEYIQAETRRLTVELGIRLGVGPRPWVGPASVSEPGGRHD